MNKISEIQLFYKNENKEHIIVTNSQSAYDVLREDWSPNTIELQEEFKLLLLDRDNKVLGVYSLSKGGNCRYGCRYSLNDGSGTKSKGKRHYFGT